jgi:uncharacterized protein (DUF111 family)
MDNKYDLYLDCRTGVSGDMVLASLIDLGVNIDSLIYELSKLNLGRFKIEARIEEKYGLKGVNVYIFEVEHVHEHNHEHEHNHNHSHNHNNEYNYNHRSFREIEKIIKDCSFPEGIEKRAVSIYKTIAEAEARAHRTDIENVHFHEVGRDTAILNIVGTAICLEFLNIKKITCSELHDGTGFIECSHGLIPVPVPAVQELLKDTGYKFIQEEKNVEMVTPSGLGILKGIQASYVEESPNIYVKVGCGFGKKELGELSVVSAYLLDKSYK